MRSILLAFSFTVVRAFAQPLEPVLLTAFPASLNEVSGTLVVGDAVWVILDSANPNALYNVDPTTGDVLRTLTISNATNTDWEELATDGEWVYIGDIGNNSGSRTDLHFLRFPVSVLLDDGPTAVEAEIIAFAYADQTDFTPSVDGTDWDCEAFVAMDDSLFLFTKDWLDHRARCYALSALPGTHSAQPRDTLDAAGLITGAAFHQATGTIALIGHSVAEEPFVWQLSSFPYHGFFRGNLLQRSIHIDPAQVEGIAWASPDTVFFSCERTNTGPARLWKTHMDLDAGIRDGLPRIADHFHPNPARGSLVIEGPYEPTLVRILDLDGRTLISTRAVHQDVVDLSGLPTGSYVFEMHLPNRTDRQPLLIVE